MSPAPPATHPADRPAGRLSDGAPLTEGPRWYRTRIRVWGPFLGLVVPGVLGSIAYWSLQLFESAWSGAIGLVGGVFAAPGLVAVGAPFGDRDIYPLAVLASGVMWLLIGLIASRRATRNPMATWGDYWRHYAWMLGGVWVGVGASLVTAMIAIGDPLI